jgi:predicted permease
MLLATLVAMQTANTGVDMRRVLAFDMPTSATGAGMGDPKVINFYRESAQRIKRLPGVDDVAIGMLVPWRDRFGPAIQFGVDGYTPADGEENPRARFRVVSPRYFAVLGVPFVAGRDFTEEDRRGSELVAIVSESVAQRLFPGADALNHHMWWIDDYFGKVVVPRRIVGVVADVDDENIVRGPAMAVYQPVQQIGVVGRLLVRAAGDPYALVPAVRRVVRDLSADQPLERAATLEDVRAELLSPDRLNAFVFSGFACIALLIAVVGVAGVLAFSVSARTREFGIRLAVGSAPRHILGRVLSEGMVIAAIGTAAGAAAGYALARLAARFVGSVQLPGALPLGAAAAVLIAAAIAASLMPAARASRVDVLQALRSE